MNKIAVFGKPAGGKSTFSKKLSEATGIQLHALDKIEYLKNGDKVDASIYEKKHKEILLSDAWIIEGFGPIDSFFERLESADTLIYIDLPYVVSYWWVTKRFLKGLFFTPEGWPDGSTILKGTIQGYRILRLCPLFWNDKFLERLEGLPGSKELHVVRSVADLNNFIERRIVGNVI